MCGSVGASGIHPPEGWAVSVVWSAASRVIRNSIFTGTSVAMPGPKLSTVGVPST